MKSLRPTNSSLFQSHKGYTLWDILSYILGALIAICFLVTAFAFFFAPKSDQAKANKQETKKAAKVSSAKQGEKENTQNIAAAQPAQTLNSYDLEAAKKVYSYCSTCHGPHGQGVPAGPKMMAPSLVGSPLALGDPEALSVAVLKGIHPSGEYLQAMIGVESIYNDADLASVLSHVRNSWGNQASIISKDQVASARSKYATLKKPIKRADIDRLPAEAAQVIQEASTQ